MTAIGPAAVHDTPIAIPAPPKPDDEDPRIGKVVGGLYRIRQRIAAGGMGVVYLAEHLHIGRKFAIKLLTANVAQNPTAIERLKQEAIAASRIEHDNIVEVFSFDTTSEGEVFIVMELLKGTDLAGLLHESGPVVLDRAVPIAVQICRAVGAAHAAGIIHRDLKPENVFLSRKGDRDFVKVLDFGISKVKDAEVDSVRMTKTGQLVGTPLYMSPEQARGETEVDRRADIYSLGVILYEMLAGETPFKGENYFQLLWKHTHESPPPPGKLASGDRLPAALETVVLRALAKEREDRFQTMEEFERALLEACPEVEAPPTYLSPSTTVGAATEPMVVTAGRRRRGVGIAVIAALAIVVAAGAWIATRGGEATAHGDRSGGDEATASPETAGPAEPSTASTAVPEPTEVTIRFESDIDGVEVRHDGTPVGTVPLGVDVPRGDEVLRYTFHRRGYVDGEQEIVPSDDRVVRIALRPIPRKGGPSTGGPSLPMKTDF